MCRHRKDVVSGKGARFLFCLRSQSDPGQRYPKYPSQPVVQCGGFEAILESREDDASS